MARNFVSADSDLISCTDIGELDGATNFSLGGWMKRDSSSTICSLSKRVDQNNIIWISLYSDGNLSATVRNGATNIWTVANNSALWQHIIMAYDGTEGTADDRIKVYINGTFTTGSHAGTHPTSSDDNSAVYNFGTAGTGPETDGDMAEQKVWSSTLTANEILSDYYGTTPSRSTLVGYWPLGYGSTEPDYSGNNHDGTLGGSPNLSDHPPIPLQFGRDSAAHKTTTADAANRRNYHMAQNLGSVNLQGGF